MIKKSNEQMREEKQTLILDNAQQVFKEKGFANVSMQDIINACDISRGGIYLYFDSKESIFKAVINRREKTTEKELEQQIATHSPFKDLIDTYLEQQKQRLLNMDHSLLRAVYEYHFINKQERDIQFRKEQVNNIRYNLELMMKQGVKENYLKIEDVPYLRDQMMFVIEGLSVYALLGGLKEETLNEQFNGLKKELYGVQDNES